MTSHQLIKKYIKTFSLTLGIQSFALPEYFLKTNEKHVLQVKSDLISDLGFVPY